MILNKRINCKQKHRLLCAFINFYLVFFCENNLAVNVSLSNSTLYPSASAIFLSGIYVVEVYLSEKERRLYDRLKSDMVLKLEDEK